MSKILEPKNLKLGISIVALLGILDAMYLINLHYNDTGVCAGQNQEFLGLVVDCGGVAASRYSEFLGIPIAIFGFLYYLAVILLHNYEKPFLSVFSRFTQFSVDQIAFGMVSFGLLVSIYLFILQVGVLKLICTYCMLSILTTIILFTLHVLLIRNPSE